jgi:hypothetical protein
VNDGLDRFVKNVGRTLGREDNTPQAQSPQNIEAQVQKGEALARLIRQLGLPADDLGIREAGD